MAGEAVAPARTGSRTSRTRRSRWRTLKIDLFEDEVFVTTPRGEAKSSAGWLHAVVFVHAVRAHLRRPTRGVAARG